MLNIRVHSATSTLLAAGALTLVLSLRLGRSRQLVRIMLTFTGQERQIIIITQLLKSLRMEILPWLTIQQIQVYTDLPVLSTRIGSQAQNSMFQSQYQTFLMFHCPQIRTSELCIARQSYYCTSLEPILTICWNIMQQ